jgi:hypothetical protein
VSTARQAREERDTGEDRGFAMAYERHCFYELLQQWAPRYEIRSALEGPRDGVDGVRGVHGTCLARRGIKVSSFVSTLGQAQTARAIYEATAGAQAEVAVASAATPLEELPVSDLVIAYRALAGPGDWRAYLHGLAKLARHALVVAVPNPRSWGTALQRLTRRLRDAEHAQAPGSCRTETLAPVLWELGRVREHVYFGAPFWQSWSKAWSSATSSAGAPFVYGPTRWPYFGGPGWSDELLPAILRSPGLQGSKVAALRVAPMHAFVVDLRPRTPQARRRFRPTSA